MEDTILKRLAIERVAMKVCACVSIQAHIYVYMYVYIRKMININKCIYIYTHKQWMARVRAGKTTLESFPTYRGVIRQQYKRKEKKKNLQIV